MSIAKGINERINFSVQLNLHCSKLIFDCVILANIKCVKLIRLQFMLKSIKNHFQCDQCDGDGKNNT